MSRRPFYITTTLPYVNADPHIGFALEIVKADIIARYHDLLGEEVFFNTGTDEHGQKIWQRAQEAGQDPQSYVDGYAARFQALKEGLGLYPGLHFIRTTDAHHLRAAQALWERCAEGGDIYKKVYRIQYCVGCELEKTDSELVEGRCPLHPALRIELIDEENYFFRFSRYQQPLLELYRQHPDFVVPDFRLNEVRAFVQRGLQDFSISRLANKMPWGVPVPGDSGHVMYVWFDALVNYISALGWPEREDAFEKFWGTRDAPNAIQLGGKDNLRQQSAMWQAMLMSAGLPRTKQVVIQGFITVGGQKMSKSLGNVIDPFDLIDAYGSDALRYYLARHTNPFDDSDFTMEKFKDAYTANLANGLGNLAARTMTLAARHLPAPIARPEPEGFPQGYADAILSFELNRAMDYIWGRISALDRRITERQPFILVKNEPEQGKRLIEELAVELYRIARLLDPFMPETSRTLETAILANQKPEMLFPRKD